MNFGDKLRSLRLSVGLTQEELASRCGMKKQNISRYENSDREPNIRTAKIIADALGVTLEDLALGGNKKMPDDFTPDEIHMVSLYRRADEIDRSSVRHILSRYEDEPPALHLAARGGADLTASPDPAQIEAALRETKSETE